MTSKLIKTTTGFFAAFFISTVFISCSDSTTTGQNPQSDLVITDIYTKAENPNAVYVKYINYGDAIPGDDFLIKLSSSKGSFEGNSNHRFTVPEPNIETETGAYQLDLLSLAKNESAQITAEIDWEDRLDEKDKSNNRLSKVIYRH